MAVKEEKLKSGEAGGEASFWRGKEMKGEVSKEAGCPWCLPGVPPGRESVPWWCLQRVSAPSEVHKVLAHCLCGSFAQISLFANATARGEV